MGWGGGLRFFPCSVVWTEILTTHCCIHASQSLIIDSSTFIAHNLWSLAMLSGSYRNWHPKHLEHHRLRTMVSLGSLEDFQLLLCAHFGDVYNRLRTTCAVQDYRIKMKNKWGSPSHLQSLHVSYAVTGDPPPTKRNVDQTDPLQQWRLRFSEITSCRFMLSPAEFCIGTLSHYFWLRKMRYNANHLSQWTM